jgi:hypothetical protein
MKAAIAPKQAFEKRAVRPPMYRFFCAAFFIHIEWWRCGNRIGGEQMEQHISNAVAIYSRKSKFTAKAKASKTRSSCAASISARI